MTPAVPGFRLALAVAALAGFVDALGFLSLGGIFVSFMSGNTTQLGTRLARGDLTSPQVVIPAAIIALFVAGVIGGTVARRVLVRRGAGTMAIVMCALLVGAALGASAGWRPVAFALTALAMGTANTVLPGPGHSTVGVTYVTGALVKLGQAIGGRLVGDRSGPWLFDLSLWACLAAGAVAGAMAYARWQLASLWIAAAAATLVAWGAHRDDAPSSAA